MPESPARTRGRVAVVLHVIVDSSSHKAWYACGHASGARGKHLLQHPCSAAPTDRLGDSLALTPGQSKALLCT